MKAFESSAKKLRKNSIKQKEDLMQRKKQFESMNE